MQILKDGMEHVGKLICSNLGARMDSEPKRWRILGLYLGFEHELFPYNISDGCFLLMLLLTIHSRCIMRFTVCFCLSVLKDLLME